MNDAIGDRAAGHRFGVSGEPLRHVRPTACNRGDLGQARSAASGR
jgi:hypothetical protein